MLENKEFKNIQTFLDYFYENFPFNDEDMDVLREKSKILLKKQLELYHPKVTENLKSAQILIEKYIDDLKNNRKPVRVSSGFEDLDNFTGRFHPSDLVILAARPGMGRILLALNIAYNSAIVEKKQVAFFSLGINRAQLLNRLLAKAARIPIIKFKDKNMSAEELERLYPEALQLEAGKLRIDDTPNLSIHDLSNRCIKIKREKGSCDLIIVNDLQLLTVPDFKKKGFRAREVSIITRSLKTLAIEMQCPVIACSQVNKGVDVRTDKRPKLSDSSQSGSIEEDGDIVLFMYRDEVYNKETLDKRIAEVIINKNRHGPIGTVKLAFEPEYASFHNLEKI